MPLYEYKCKSCGHRFEVIQKFSDSPVRKCPKCGKAVEKLVSSSAIQFKGTGWYVTDYAKKSGSSSEPSQTEPSKTESSGGAASDSEKSSPAADKSKSEKAAPSSEKAESKVAPSKPSTTSAK